jgi:hypothetical protein
MIRSDGARVALLWLLLSGAVIGVAAPPPGEPGLYYDEAFLAQQARDFLEPDRPTRHPPGATATYVDGRPFPLRNAAYLGSLKSQLLIPVFAVFGADVPTLRTATLVTALVGLLFAMLFALRIFGLWPALFMGVLVASDPSFVFFGSCEWAPFTTLLACRSVGLWALTRGWQTRHGALVVLGAFAMGLGVYARADFAIVGAAVALGWIAARGLGLVGDLRERLQTVVTAVAAAGVGSLPMLASLPDLLATQQAISDRGDLAYRAQVLWSTLDGSHFHRLMQTGGLFERIFEVGAPAGALAAAAVIALALAAAASARPRSRDPATVFLAVTAASLASAMCLLPGAVRAHHMLNLMPFAHLLVAVVLARAARSAGARVAAAVLVLGLALSGARVTALTRAEIAETGGRGRWSNALDAFAAELDADPEAVAVSLDWGFHEPLLFLTDKRSLLEPIWHIPRLLARGRPWVHAGDARHRYLVHDAAYDLFGIGAGLLDAARAAGPELAEIRSHRDRRGEVAFHSVRFRARHELVYTGEFDVRFPPEH